MDTAERSRRGRLLYVALGFLRLDVAADVMPPELRTLHAWLDTWHGIGLIAHGLARQDRDLSLTRYRDRWGATVFVTGREHSIVQGTGWQPTPWDAVQQPRFRRCTGVGIGVMSRRCSKVCGHQVEVMLVPEGGRMVLGDARAGVAR